jgi:hypothetical protein
MLKEAIQYEDERLKRETKESQEFCDATTPRSKQKHKCW